MYCYQCNQKNIRLTIMNNLLPSKVKMHLKFDLKGSTYKRKVSVSNDSFFVSRLEVMKRMGNKSFPEKTSCQHLIIVECCTKTACLKVLRISFSLTLYGTVYGTLPYGIYLVFCCFKFKIFIMEIFVFRRRNASGAKIRRRTRTWTLWRCSPRVSS
jgi:hypothetical protein